MGIPMNLHLPLLGLGWKTQPSRPATPSAVALRRGVRRRRSRRKARKAPRRSGVEAQSLSWGRVGNMGS